METQEAGMAREIPCTDPPTRWNPAGTTAAAVVVAGADVGAPVVAPVVAAEALGVPVADPVAEVPAFAGPSEEEHAVSAMAMPATVSSARPLLLTDTPAHPFFPG
jgi:hypothetical protein